MKRLILLILLASALITGCKPKEIIKERTVTIRERIKEEIHTRDTIFNIEADSAALVALVKCDSLNRAYIETLSSREGERTRIIYRLKLDTLRIRAQVDSAAIYHTWHERTRTIEQETDTAIQTTKEIRQPIHPGVVIAGLLLILIILGMVKNIVK